MNECYESECKVFWADFEGGEANKVVLYEHNDG